jgi:cytochrome c
VDPQEVTEIGRGYEVRSVIFVGVLAVASISGARAQDAAAGETVFAVCKVCHQIGANAKNSIGPALNGIIGRKAGTYPGYTYSAANKNSDITWDDATFREYITDPKAKIPGTKMIYAGLKDEQKTRDLLAHLKQFGPDGKKE